MFVHGNGWMEGLIYVNLYDNVQDPNELILLIIKLRDHAKDSEFPHAEISLIFLINSAVAFEKKTLSK